MEGLRYLPMLSKKGWLITNTKTHINVPNYPAVDDLISEIAKVPNHIAIDADQTARDLGNHRAANIIMLGAATPFLEIDEAELEEALKTIFKTKGKEIIELNIKALRAGKEFANQYVIG
jgi:indolepyruvate ferredoxin oxidoreductase beta subunit